MIPNKPAQRKWLKTGPKLQLSHWSMHWTFLPKRMDNGEIVYCSYYYKQKIHCDAYGSKPIKQPYWEKLYSKKSYLMLLLKE